MAVVTNPFKITYAGEEVGGSDIYQLHGPYVLEKSYENFRLVFDVVVVGTSHSNLQSLSSTLEDSFRKRLGYGASTPETLIIDINGSTFTFTHGTTILNCLSSIVKTGNEETDFGFSRSYTITIEGELPADATFDVGLRDVEVLVELEAGRQQIVTMRGVYTATTAGSAKARYEADFDAEAAIYLLAVDSSATFELVDESYTFDRNLDTSATPDVPLSHTLNFTRQYVELLVNQSVALLDDTSIRDHRVTFTELHQHPGDSKENIYRLRRVIASYDCAIDIDIGTNLQTVFDTKVKAHVQALFELNFTPQVFATEDTRIGYDETTKRMSVAIQFIYQAQGGDAIVEVQQSVTIKESRTLDYTWTHGADEVAANVDVGFARIERVWSRAVLVIGTEIPKHRISAKPGEGSAGLFNDTVAGIPGPDGKTIRVIKPSGWNIVENSSQVTPGWIGDPNGTQQIQATLLTETIVERFTRAPGNRTQVNQKTSGPITPRK